MTPIEIAHEAVRLYAESHPRPVTITQKQAAEMLGKSEPYIRTLIKRGTIRLNKLGQVPITEIDKAIAATE